MDESDIFQNRSDNDLEMAKLCFKESDFELSSYLIQQSLEKSIKAYLLKNNAIEHPEELKHLPLSKIFGLFKEDLKRLMKKNQNQPYLFTTIQQNIKLVEKLSKLFNDVVRQPKKSRTKIPIWKTSLGLPLNQKETMAYQTEFKEMQTFAISGNENLKKHADSLTDEKYEMIKKNLIFQKNKLMN